MRTVAVLEAVLLVALVVLALGLARSTRSGRRALAALRDRLRQGDHRLAHSEQLFRALVHNAGDATLVVDATGEVQYASPALARLLGRPVDAALGRPFVGLVDQRDEERATALLDQVLQESESIAVTSLRLRHADGTERHVELVMKNLVEDSAVRGVVVNAHDTTEREELEAQLVQQAFYDSLTGLANRALFHERVEHALRSRQRHPEGFAVLLLDLDGFKAVNDAFGHAAGDLLLQSVASRLQYCVRPDDTVARLGGDEFALFLEHLDASPGSTDAVVTAGKVAERVLTALADPVPVAGRSMVVTGSVGVAFVDQTTRGVGELLRNADLAMYAAKGQGKNRAVVYRPDLHEEASTRLTLGAELRQAMDHLELALHYQPVIDMATGAVVGAEALLRWPHLTRGLVSPLEFVPLAEESGLIVPIGEWVLREACRQAALWRAELPPEAPFVMSVNVSGRQFQAQDFSLTVREALAVAGLSAEHLVLELTESVLMADDEASREQLATLRRLGLGLAIDDFGTGYSSLAYLQQFPVTALKIDRSFVAGLDGAVADSAVARAVLQIGHTLGLDVVAEGVERPGQAAALQRLDCRHAQGFLYSKPVPPEEFARLLTAPPLGVPAPRGDRWTTV